MTSVRFELHAYGLMLAIGVLVAAKIADKRWRRAGNDSKVIARDRGSRR